MDKNNDGKELSFVEHLEELRRRLIYCLVFISVFFFASLSFSKQILHFLTKDIDTLVYITPTEVFVSYLYISLVTSVALSLPVIFYNIWKFVWVALTERERKAAAVYIPLSAIFFLLGTAFSFYAVIPLALKFLLSMAPEGIRPMLSVLKYISFIGMMMLVFGLAFELPMVLTLLTRLGIVNHIFLSRKRRHAILIIFIVAAIFTPPDAFTQILLAVPLVLLYEIGILFSRMASPRSRL